MKEGTASNINYNIAYWFYLPVVFYYCLFVVNDQISNLFLFLSLLSATSVFNPKNHKKLHISIGLLSLVDAILKGLMVYKVIPELSYFHLDLSLITNIINLNLDKFDQNTLIYVALIVLSWICAVSYNVRLKTRTQTYEQLKFLQFLSTTLDYATPALLYVLCFTKLTNNNSFRQWLQTLTPQISEIQLGQFQMFEQAAWGLITALYLINRGQSNALRKMLAISIILLIIRDNITQLSDPNIILYQIKWKYITIIKIALLVFFRVHNKTVSYSQLVIQHEEATARSICQSRISSQMRYVNRRKLNDMQSMNHIFVLLLIILTIITMILTNGLGNVVVIIGLALNFPFYQESKFRKILGVGVTISLLLQPEQFIYFVYLYLIRLFTTQSHVFNLKNWWIIIQLMRIIVLFSKVSLLNFLIGLFQSYWLVAFTLIFRTCCSFYGEIIVFMGTEDYYNYYVKNIIPTSVFIDLILWTYFLLLKIYSPISSVRFQSTDITNIFIQYPFINSIQKVLKVLKIFHWIAYAAISLVILNSHPSLFTLMRIIPLVIAFTLGILESHKSELTYRLWSWNLYTSIAIAFVKYFYLLSQYDNLSLWLIRLLTPLMEHYQFIGLTPPSKVSLPILFGLDFFLIIVNAIVLFIIKVQVSQLNYQAARARIYQQEHLQSRLLANEEQTQEKGVHYLYNKYIKPINMDFRERQTIRPIFTDFILDISFCSFLIVFYIFPSNQFQPNYAPHFGLFLFGFLKQKGKHIPNHFFQFFVGICSLDLLFIYCKYFYSLIKATEMDYNISSVVSKYLLLVIGVIFKQINFSLNRFYHQHQVIKRPEHSFLLFRLLAPPIPNQQIKKQIIILYLHLFKILSLSYFISTLIAGDQIIRNIHLIVLMVSALILLFFRKFQKQFFKRFWMKAFIFGVLLDLYVGHLQMVLCLMFLRGYFMILQEFDLFIFVERYDRTNKTANEQCMKNIEQKQQQLQEKYNIPVETRLQVITQVQQRLQNSILDKTIEDITFWKHKNTYITVVWLLPILFILIIAIGVLFYIKGIFGFTIFLINFMAVLIALIQLFSFTITHKIIKWLVLIGSCVIPVSLQYEYVFNDGKKQQILQNYGFGLFLIMLGTFGYFSLLKHNNNSQINNNLLFSFYINFCERRSLEACQYWKKKCQMVSQLGSQIHNQKKMTSLRKFFLNRQNLGVKVEQLETELKSKSAHRKSRFQSLQKLQNEEERQQTFKKDQFQVYSNMLTFMSMQDLQFCYLNLNQYYKGDVGVHIDLAEATSKVRQWILQNYSESLCETIKKYQQLAFSSQLSIAEHPTIKVLPPQIEKELSSSRLVQDTIQNKTEQNKIQLHVRFASYGQNLMEQSNHSHEKLMKQRQKIGSSLVSNSSFPSRLRQEFGERIDMRLNELSWPIRKLVQNIEILGLIITAGWNFFGGVYTIPTNIAIFSWAIVLETKTTVVFWLFLMSYSFIILSCKLLIQYLPKHFFINFLFYYHPNDYLYEFIIILVSAIEIIFLKMGGTSEIAYSQRQNIFDAFYRNILNQSSRGKRKSAEPQFLEMYKCMRHANKHSFFYRVFSKGRLKPGKDLYPMLAILQVIILLYIFFFYDMMEFESKNNRKSLGEILTVTQFSKNMILALFFQVMIMIADRLIVSLNFIDKLNQKLQNFFFNMAFKSEMKYTTLEAEQLSQMGKFDFLLIIKYIFHVLLLVIINFFVYFYIPSGGMQKSLIPQCENAVCGKSYNYLSLFLFLYLIYFVISGLQIKHGFNRNKCRNTLMERYHWVDFYIYVFFTGIPFLWEFKKISDWTTTATALPLFHWMKFQDINARMYRSKCEAEILRIKTLGKGPWYKLFLGPPGFFFILAIIFSPIIMYSSLNPFAVKDSILAASSRLELVMNGNIHYQFFQTSHTTILDDSQLNSKQKLLGLFDRADLYKLQTSSYPDQDFTLSEPALVQLAETLRQISFNQSQSSIQFRLIMEVSEKIGGDTSIIWGSKVLSKIQVDSLYQTVTSNTERLEITKFFSPLPGQITNQSIILFNRNHGQYYELYTSRLNADSGQSEDNLPGVFVFYKSSVKYKIAFGLLTFYLTYVVLINSLCRFYLTGSLETVLFQGPELQKILFLCEAVRSARILENFYQEQYLYFSLVDLMRYPRMIKDIADDFSNLRTEAKMKLQ